MASWTIQALKICASAFGFFILKNEEKSLNEYCTEIKSLECRRGGDDVYIF